MAMGEESGGVVDLGALRATQEDKDRLRSQLLGQVGLMCACGQRMRAGSVTFFALVEGFVPSPNGPAPGLTINAQILCSTKCRLAPALMEHSIAARDSNGCVVWFDEAVQEPGAA